jgi:hypothetical protein
MFLRKYQRTKDGKRHTYFALVESRRTQRGPRQRIVAQLGELMEDQEHRWQRTAVFHTRPEEGNELPLFAEDDSAPAVWNGSSVYRFGPRFSTLRHRRFSVAPVSSPSPV